MPVSSWSSTPGSNTGILTGITLDGAVMNVPLVDDSFREMAAQIAAQLGKMNFAGADMASAGTLNLANATGWSINVTGTTAITALGTVAAGQMYILRFADALTLTHNATTLILPGGVNIVTVANDVAIVISLGGGAWRCLSYQRSAGVSFIRQQFVTASGAIALHAETRYFLVEALGGGGGGGGCVAGAAANGAGAGGGASGGYVSQWVVRAANTVPTCTIGAAGFGTAGAGSLGGTTIYSDGAYTLTANGGGGGAAATVAAAAIGAGGQSTGASGGQFSQVGNSGFDGWGMTVSSAGIGIANGGHGADSPFGAGGHETTIAAANGGFVGNAALGYGAGGGGSCATGSGATQGGSGSPGLIRIAEFR